MKPTPMNGRLLIKIDKGLSSVDTSMGKQHENAIATGVVLAVADDADQLIKQMYYKDKDINFVKPSELVGKKIRWEKFAEQNSVFDDPEMIGQKLALIGYKDIIAYEK